MEKECFKCHIKKPLTEFYKHPEMTDGTVNKCKDCNKKDNQKNWHENREEKRKYDLYRHRHSVQRLFNHKYAMIKSRCTYKRKQNYTVFGMDFLNKNEWNTWCYEDKNFSKFIQIYNTWVQSGFERKLTPSIDRIDNTKGYIVENLQWLTLSENCKKHKA